MRALCKVVRYAVVGLLLGAVVAVLIRRAKAAAAPPRAPHAPVWPPFEPVVAEAPVSDPVPAPEPEPELASEPAPELASVDPVATVDAPAWVAPVDGRCPEGYPVKANDRSRIYHVPGGRSYERTVPERCYADPESAAADGYRAAKA